MNDLLLIFTCLSVFTAVGYLPSRLLPEKTIRGRILAAPVIGFGLFGVVTTILYRFGWTPFNSLIFLSALSVSAIVYWGLKVMYPPLGKGGMGGIINKNIILFCLIALFTIGITILPKWLGGPQFYAFQGNQKDHFNYLSEAYSYQHYSYEDLQLVDLNNTKNPILPTGILNLSARPTVGIVLAAFSGLFHATNALASYSYMVLMQINMLFASTFIIINIFNLKLPLASLISLGLTIGFFQQYIFDINAWSQLACMPVFLLSLGLIIIFFAPAKFPDIGQFNWQNKTLISLMLLIALTIVSVFFYYPEIIPIYAIASSTAIAVSWLVSPNKHSVKIRLLYFLISIALAILIARIYWKGTLGFLMYQVNFGSNKLTTNSWAKYFEGYLLGREFFVLGQGFHFPENFFYRIFSLPIDFVTSMIGLYYVLPDGNFSIVFRCLWRVLLYIFLGLIVFGSYQSIVSIWKSEKTTSKSIFFAVAISTLSLPLALVGAQNFWVAGKALSMASPFLYFIIIAPLLNNFAYVKFKNLSLFVIVLYLVGQIWFGLIRPMAATNAFGIHYMLPYPSVLFGNSLKTMFLWNFEGLIPTLKQCHQINIDINEFSLETYTEVFLSDLGLPWTSVNPITTFYGTKNLGFQKPFSNPDCLMTINSETLKTLKSGQKLIWLRIDKTP